MLYSWTEISPQIYIFYNYKISRTEQNFHANRGGIQHMNEGNLNGSYLAKEE